MALDLRLKAGSLVPWVEEDDGVAGRQPLGLRGALRPQVLTLWLETAVQMVPQSWHPTGLTLGNSCEEHQNTRPIWTDFSLP